MLWLKKMKKSRRVFWWKNFNAKGENRKLNSKKWWAEPKVFCFDCTSSHCCFLAVLRFGFFLLWAEPCYGDKKKKNFWGPSLMVTIKKKLSGLEPYGVGWQNSFCRWVQAYVMFVLCLYWLSLFSIYIIFGALFVRLKIDKMAERMTVLLSASAERTCRE